MNNNYIIVGDSITYGIGDFESGGWSAMLKKYIVNKDDSKVCNNYVHIAGFSGATSTDILNRIEYIFNSFKFEESNNIVILSIGINDSQEFNGNNKNSIEKYKSNIEKIAKYIMKQDAELIILGLTRVESDEKFFWKPNKYYDNKVILEYDKNLEALIKDESGLKEFFKENKIKYISMQNVLQKGDFIDGLHPNQKGHKKIFERVKEFLND